MWEFVVNGAHKKSSIVYTTTNVGLYNPLSTTLKICVVETRDSTTLNISVVETWCFYNAYG